MQYRIVKIEHLGYSSTDIYILYKEIQQVLAGVTV